MCSKTRKCPKWNRTIISYITKIIIETRNVIPSWFLSNIYALKKIGKKNKETHNTCINILVPYTPLRIQIYLHVRLKNWSPPKICTADRGSKKCSNYVNRESSESMLNSESLNHLLIQLRHAWIGNRVNL